MAVGHPTKPYEVAEVVQQYLNQIRAEHLGLRDGALASYIPQLADVDPDGFGLALSSSDGARLTASGEQARLVHPDGRVAPGDRPGDHAELVFRTVDDAVEATGPVREPQTPPGPV